MCCVCKEEKSMEKKPYILLVNDHWIPKNCSQFWLEQLCILHLLQGNLQVFLKQKEKEATVGFSKLSII